MRNPCRWPLLPKLLDTLWAGPGMGAVRGAVDEFTALLMPTECACCRRPDTGLCEPCRAALRAGTVRPVRVEDGAEALPLDAGGHPLPVLAAGSYERELAAALLAFKNRQRVGLRHALGPALAGVLWAGSTQWAGGAPVFLVPVPSRTGARLRRGYWPLGVLLGWITRRRLLPGGMRVSPLLRYRHGWFSRGGQKGRGRLGRRAVRGSMRVRRGQVPAPGSRVILLDDVLTTGATLAECHRVLSERGWLVSGAMVVAATGTPHERG